MEIVKKYFFQQKKRREEKEVDSDFNLYLLVFVNF